MIIMLVGLTLDIFNTWLQNTAILRNYMEHRKERKAKPAPEPEKDLEEEGPGEAEAIAADEGQAEWEVPPGEEQDESDQTTK